MKPLSPSNPPIPRRTMLRGAGSLLLAAAGAAGAAGCGGKSDSDGPVAIKPTDTCDSCGMLISDVRRAAQIVGSDDVWKFDDIGEMFAFYKQHRLTKQQVKAVYAHEYRGKSWLPASSAGYLVSPRFPTPMGSGVAAFKDAKAARQAATSKSDSVRTYQQLMANPPQPSPMH